jgi:hypothetical protein
MGQLIGRDPPAVILYLQRGLAAHAPQPHVDRPAQSGLGLGLFICRELIAAHGGHITVASTEGHGTTFTVWLPLREGEAPARDVPTCPRETGRDTR